VTTVLRVLAPESARLEEAEPMPRRKPAPKQRAAPPAPTKTVPTKTVPSKTVPTKTGAKTTRDTKKKIRKEQREKSRAA
jgi:hypothetical protein